MLVIFLQHQQQVPEDHVNIAHDLITLRYRYALITKLGMKPSP